MVVVSTNARLGVAAAELTNDSRRIFHSSGPGTLIAILEDAAGVLTYKTAPSSGSPWSSAGALMGAAGTTYGPMFYVADVLYVVSIVGGSMTLTSFAFSTGASTFGAATTHIIDNFTVTGVLSMGACWDGTRFHITTAESDAVEIFNITPAGVGAGAQAGEIGHVSAGASAFIRGMAVIPGTPATILVLVQNGSSGPLSLCTVTWNGSSYGTSTQEALPGGNVLTAACALDPSNYLDILFVDASGKLQAMKRTGSGSYGSLVPVATGVATSPSISLITGSAGDLFVYFPSTANRANAEIYVAQRSSGTWQNPALFAGGDDAGYRIPRSSSAINGTHTDLLYQVGTTAPFAIDYTSMPTGSAPNTPVPLEPAGNETSLTPTASYTYSNPNPLDPQGKTEYLFKEGATVNWDSGAITTAATSNVYGTNTNSGDPNSSAALGLVYGHTYTWSVRNQDLISGLWSGWSTPVTFTPVRGGTVTITQIVDNAITLSSSPSTIQAPQFDSITGDWTQLDGHVVDRYQDTVWDSALATIIDQTGELSTGGVMPFTSPNWLASHLVNGGSYKLVRAYRDATTLLWSFSAPWVLNAAWAPPPPVTSVAVVIDNTTGTIRFNWTNPIVGVSSIIQRSKTGAGLYTVLPKTGLFATATDYPKLLTGYDYQIIAVNALGIQSTPYTVTNQQVTENGYFGVCLTDARVPDKQAWFGVLDQGDWRNASEFMEPSDAFTATAFGQELPFYSERLDSHSEAQNRAYSVPAIGRDANGAIIYGADTIAMLRAMKRVGHACLYRDITGEFMYLKIIGPKRGISGNGWPMMRVEMDLKQVQGPNGALTPMVA